MIATLAKRRNSLKLYHRFKHDFSDKRTLDHNKIYTPNERENQRTQVVYFFKLQHCFFIIYFSIKSNAFHSILLTFRVIDNVTWHTYDCVVFFCVVFFLSCVLSTLCWQVFLDCPFLIASYVLSTLCWQVFLDCPFLIASYVLSTLCWQVFLDCPFLIASSVLSNVYFNWVFFLTMEKYDLNLSTNIQQSEEIFFDTGQWNYLKRIYRLLHHSSQHDLLWNKFKLKMPIWHKIFINTSNSQLLLQGAIVNWFVPSLKL